MTTLLFVLVASVVITKVVLWLARREQWERQRQFAAWRSRQQVERRL